MAILTNNPATATDSGAAPNLSPAELAQLISRLKQTVLHPPSDRERRLRTSEYERTRVESNLEFARAALNKFEQSVPGTKVDAHIDVVALRETLEASFDRIEDLRKVAADDDEDSSEGEDLLGDMATPSESLNSRRSSDALREGTKSPEPEPPEPVAELERTPEPSSHVPLAQESQPGDEAPTQTSQSLRARGSAPSPSPSSHSTARAALFANRRKPAAPQTSTATAEAILDQQRVEQDAISDSILKLAGALKQSSKSFSATLESDKGLLDAAGMSMEKSEVGMEAAQGRMGSLKRMTEGKGWWGRMILYAWVYGLMVSLVLLVFVFPKLRF